MQTFINARVNEDNYFTKPLIVKATMCEYAIVKKPRESITISKRFSEGFSFEEILTTMASELAIEWFIKYGVDSFSNCYGVFERITINEEERR